MQIDPFIRFRSDALRETQSWLLARAREMNDLHARQVLNSAESDWGNEKLRCSDRETRLPGHADGMAGNLEAEPMSSPGGARDAGQED